MNDTTLERTQVSGNLASKTHDSRVSHSEYMSRVQIVADMLSNGTRSTPAIAGALGVSRTSAIKLRNDALILIAEESKPMNREALRNLEIGRLNGLIERLTNKISSLEWPNDIKAKEYNITLNTYDKLLGRLKDFGEQLHKITGMNTEINVTIEEKRRIVFVRPIKPIHNDDTQEGEIVDTTQAS